MKKLLSVALLLSPALALAQTNVTDVNSLTKFLSGMGTIIVYILTSLAVVFIVYNIVMYLVHGNKPEEKSKNLGNVGWGILGLAIILSIWGLVGIITRSFVTTAPVNSNIPSFGQGVQQGGVPGAVTIPQLNQ